MVYLLHQAVKTPNHCNTKARRCQRIRTLTTLSAARALLRLDESGLSNRGVRGSGEGGGGLNRQI